MPEFIDNLLNTPMYKKFLYGMILVCLIMSIVFVIYANSVGAASKRGAFIAGDAFTTLLLIFLSGLYLVNYVEDECTVNKNLIDTSYSGEMTKLTQKNTELVTQLQQAKADNVSLREELAEEQRLANAAVQRSKELEAAANVEDNSPTIPAPPPPVPPRPPVVEQPAAPQPVGQSAESSGE